MWTQESTCHLIETNIRDQEELEGKKVPQYPCLWVNVSAVGRWAVLYHTEDTRDRNQQVLDWGMGAHSLNPNRCLNHPYLAPIATVCGDKPGPPLSPCREWRLRLRKINLLAQGLTVGAGSSQT